MRYESNNNYLIHYGIKGQKWGQRRFQNSDGSYTPEGKERYRKSGSESNYSLSVQYPSSKNRAQDRRQLKKELKKFKKEVEQIEALEEAEGERTHEEVVALQKRRNREIQDLLKANKQFDEMEEAEEREWKRQNSGKGPARGMGPAAKGVYDKPDGTKDTKRLQKDAKKDAEDMARAKAYYGEGAGNRRKQIRNRISERMKDPDYKAEYEKHLAAQDMSKHQKAANRERHVQDAKNTVAKTGRGIKNLILGVGGASMTAVALYNVAKLTGADKKIADFGKKAVSDIMNKARSMKKPSVKDYIWYSSENEKRNSSNSGKKESSSKQNRRDFVEKMDRAKHGNRNPWIDENGNIHFR